VSENKKSIKIYQNARGQEPFVEWLQSLKDRKTRSRIITRLDRLEVGNPGDHKHIQDGVFELRLHFGAGYRVYYGEDGPVIIILLIGGDKSTQGKDIEKALSFWESYKEAKK
jgi:putative addiction module killer protein